MKTDLEKALQTQIAMQMIESLDEGMRKEILAEGVKRQLSNLQLDYEVEKIIKEEAMVFAREYIQQPEIQEQLREKAYKVVDDIIDGIVKTIGRGIENDIKNNYTRILSDKAYGER